MSIKNLTLKEFLSNNGDINYQYYCQLCKDINCSPDKIISGKKASDHARTWNSLNNYFRPTWPEYFRIINNAPEDEMINPVSGEKMSLLEVYETFTDYNDNVNPEDKITWEKYYDNCINHQQ